MPDLVVWMCLGLAAVCVGYATLGARRDNARRDRLENAPPGAEELVALLGTPDDRIAALVVGFLLALLGVGAAAVDHKVDDAGTARADEAVSLDLSTSEREHAAFSRIARVHSGPIDHDLCLVRFYTKAHGPAGPWWTDCGQGRSLETVGQARSRLALRHDWGPYDARAEYTVPEGTDVTYLQGTVAPQCRKGNTQGCPRYRGGGQQYFFPNGLDPGDAVENERCASSKQSKPPPSAKYVRC